MNTNLLRYLDNDEAQKLYEDRLKEIEERVAKRLYFKAYRLNNKERLQQYERERYLKNKERKQNVR